MCRELEEDRADSTTYYRRHTGELILGPTTPMYNDPEFLAEREGLPFVAPFQMRKKFFRMLLRQVARVGLQVEYDQRIEQYYEDEQAGRAGVVIKGGATRDAHIVVAADAFRSASELLIAGEHMPTRSSGMSVYRTAFPTELALKNDDFVKQWGDVVTSETLQEFWLGPGMHIGILISPDVVAWGLTPRDHHLLPGGTEPTESWDPDVDPKETLKVLHSIEGWGTGVDGLMQATPQGAVVHWPLLWRNLRRQWTSKSGRVVQVGDAAHTTVPSSVSGGTLALEDAVSLAACLELACIEDGPAGAPTGPKTYNVLRYERVSCVQKMAFVNSELMGATDWDEVKKNPAQVRLRFPKWVFRHDPEAYVYENFAKAREHVLVGTEFKNTNIPPGFSFKPWTIEEIHEDVLAGKRINDFLQGDWS
nr:fad-dependent monooxygenase mdpd [Quercus suber]